MQKNNISEDLHILRTPEGILLAKSKKQYLKNYYDTNHTVKSILQLPCNIYFSSLEHRYQLINDFCAMSCGFDSTKNAQNKTIFVTANNKSAQIILDNNNDVMRKQKLKIIEEELILNNNTVQQGLSIKLPYYNIDEKISGIFGFTIIFGKQKLDRNLSYIADAGILNTNKYLSLLNENHFCFTKREKEIIFLIRQNKTSKEMGKQLYVSPRTIEKHIENIKYKLSVKSKFDIFNKIIEE